MTENRIQGRNKFFMTNQTDPAKTSENFLINLRKSKRKNHTAFKRKLNELSLLPIQSCSNKYEISDQLISKFPVLNSFSSDYMKLCALKEILSFPEASKDDFYNSLKAFRTALIEYPDTSLLQILADMGMIPIFCEVIKRSKTIDHVAESIWCLCNIAATSDVYTNEILNCDVIDSLIEWIKSGIESLTENAVWMIANLLGGNKELKLRMIEKGLLELIREVKIESRDFAEGASLCLVNLVREEEILNESNLRIILSSLKKIEKIDVCEYLTVIESLANGKDWVLDIILSERFCDIIFEGILNKNPVIKLLCVQIVSHISAGSKEHTEYLVENKIVDKIFLLLIEPDSNLLYFIYISLKNIVIDSKKAAKEITSHKNFCILFEGLMSPDKDVRKQASYFLLNLSFKLRAKDIDIILDSNLISYLHECLKTFDLDLLVNSLSILFVLLNEEKEKISKSLKLFQILPTLEDLSCHLNKRIQECSKVLLSLTLSVSEYS